MYHVHVVDQFLLGTQSFAASLEITDEFDAIMFTTNMRIQITLMEKVSRAFVMWTLQGFSVILFIVHDTMVFQATLRLKLTPAHRTFGLCCRMHGVSMSYQQRPFQKFVRTFCAAINAMAILVSHQIIAIHEAALTMLTRIWILFGVTEHMLSVLGFAAKHGVAQVTAE